MKMDTVMSTKLDLAPHERVLLIIHDNGINGLYRFQKYGYFLYKECAKDLEKLKIRLPIVDFYNDWKSYSDGPYSEELQKDISTCVYKGILIDEKCISPKYRRYDITRRGHDRWKSIFKKETDLIIKINDKIRSLFYINDYNLLIDLYRKYPECVSKNKFKEVIF